METKLFTESFYLTLPDGGYMPRLGQGTWRMGEDPGARDREVEALKYGVRLGINMIDTAEMYADGEAEAVAGDAVRDFRRQDVFLVSKVYPWNAGKSHIEKSCARTLARLGVERLDLYLLHWREDADLAEVAYCMEKLVSEGRIGRWGVSNFDTADMEDLWKVPDGPKCAVNQVLYNLGSRGIEFDLMPWQRDHGIPFMAYCPVAQGGSLRNELLGNGGVLQLARKYGVAPMQVLLAFVLRHPDMAAIPKAVGRAHVAQNAATKDLRLTEEDVELLSASFPAPKEKMEMEKI